MKPINRIFLFLLFISVSYAISYAQENQSYFLHTIEKGQSLYSISKMYNVTTSDIIRLNPGCDEKIYAGQTIKIPTRLIDKYMVRHFIKPGVTGWAQTHGFRGETRELSQMEERVKADIWYMEHWTIFLDLYIIYKTIANVVIGEKNAY